MKLHKGRHCLNVNRQNRSETAQGATSLLMSLGDEREEALGSGSLSSQPSGVSVSASTSSDTKCGVAALPADTT